MYAIDDDTDELVRYSFRSNEYIVIGEVVEDNGHVVDEIEALGFIPHGPHKGLYGVTNHHGDLQTKLVKIDVFDGTATVYPDYTGFGNVEGLVGFRHAGGDWDLYAVNSAKVAQGGGGKKNLLKINPATGLGTVVMHIGARFEGLAQGSDGTLYGARGHNLWTIDPAGGTVTKIGSHGFSDVEALEYAYGDYGLNVDVPGIPDEWTADGVLFGFADDQDTVVILNPATGEAAAWVCAVNTTDLEGMVFATMMTDPWGPIVANPSD
jgi:hypothetical protein